MMAIVVYDIPDDKRRVRLAEFLEGYGSRVQKSVFEVFLSLDEMRVLHRHIQQRVEPTEDNVRIYWIPRGAVARALTIGSAPPQEPPEAYII